MLLLNKNRLAFPETQFPSANLLDQFFNGPLESSEGFPVDVCEDEVGFYLEAELPGFKKEEVHIELDQNRLVISAEKAKSEEVEEKNYHLHERSQMRLSRAFRLPKIADFESIDAKMENGLLHLTIAKIEEPKPREIEID